MSAEGIVLILGAVGALITVLTTAWVNIRKNVKEVHKIVNQQRTDMLAYQKTLVDTLRASGIHVPTDKSLLKE